MFRDQFGESVSGFCGLKAEQTRYVVLRRSMYNLRTADVFPVDRTGRPPPNS